MQKIHLDNRGIIWYYKFKKEDGFFSLLDKHSRKSLLNKFLIALTYSYKDKDLYIYTVFDDYIQFYKYQSTILLENRCYFETILGEAPQKPYFDIDIKIEPNNQVDPNSIKNDLILCLVSSLIDFDIYIEIDKDIIVCTSHRSDKYSYHIILDNFCFENCNENKSFCNYVVNKMTPDNRKYIDTGLYKSLQQFRLLGSHKKNINNVKILQEEYYINNIKIKYRIPTTQIHNIDLYKFEHSIITNCKYCSILPSFQHQNFDGNKYENENPIDLDTVKLVMKKLSEYSGLSIYDPIFPYKFSKIEGRIISLKRVRPSKCRICTIDEKNPVIHEHENPYLTLDSIGNIYFSCRRAKNGTKDKMLLIGNIPVAEPNIEDIKNDSKKEKKLLSLDLINKSKSGVTYNSISAQLDLLSKINK